MRYQDDESFLDTGNSKSGAKPRSGRRGPGGGGRAGGWSGGKGGVNQRLRAAQRLPQAVFKISSYSHSSGAVWERVNYVGRDGELEVEAPNGEMLGQVAVEQLVEEWSEEGTKENRTRIAMSAIVTFTAEVDKEAATEAARQFFGEAFGKNHDYVFAAHDDTKNFHVHVVVRTAGQDGQQLRIGRDDIQPLRELLAEQAHEQGIELDASPRWARGLEPEERLSRQAEAQLRRGVEIEQINPQEKSIFTKEAQEIELEGPGSIGGAAGKKALAEERARRRRGPEAAEYQALEYGRAAAELAAQIPQMEKPTDKIAALKGAAQLAAFGLQLTNHAADKPKDIAATRAVMVSVDKAINSQIRGLKEGGPQKEAITARRGLAEKLSEYQKAEEAQFGQRVAVAAEGVKRQRTERRRTHERAGLETPEAQVALGQERERERERDHKPNAAASPALEYARASGRLASQIGELEGDDKKVAAVKAAVELGGKAWAAAEGLDSEAAKHSREIIAQVEGVIHNEIHSIKGGPAKQQAIRADRQLAGRLVEYRAEQREQAVKLPEAEKKRGVDLEL